MRRLTLQVLAATFIAQLGYAHQQPTTLIILNVGSDDVSMKLHIPLSELELAFGHKVSQNPEGTIALWRPSLREYLVKHIHPVTYYDQAWSVQVRHMEVGNAVQTQSGPFQEVNVQLSMIPPAGASPRHFILKYDAIMHQVVTHKALVSIHSNWTAGQVEPIEVGVIAVDTGTSRIEPLAINLGEGNWWTGFRGMVGVGMQHIREGLDHLLFLVVLLLPATLIVRGGKWGEFAGTDRSLIRLLKIVSSFTLGHSATLLLAARG